MAQLRPVDLEGRVALVVGGTGELGAALVDLLGSAGAEVAVAGEPGPILSRMAIRLGAETYECDPSDPDAPRAATAEMAGRLGRVDLLVCLRDSDTDLEATTGALRDAGTTIAAAGRGGRILLVVGAAPPPAVANGTVERSTFAAGAAVRELATTLAADRVVVNAVRHGPLRAPDPDEWQEEEIPVELGSLSVADLARAAIWLLDPEVEDVSGVVVDLGVGAGTEG